MLRRAKAGRPRRVIDHYVAYPNDRPVAFDCVDVADMNKAVPLRLRRYDGANPYPIRAGSDDDEARVYARFVADSDDVADLNSRSIEHFYRSTPAAAKAATTSDSVISQ